MLKIREQQPQGLTPTPSTSMASSLTPLIQFINRPPNSIIDYVSEPEIEYDYTNIPGGRFQNASPFSNAPRPASVTPSLTSSSEYKKSLHLSGKASPMSRLPPLPSSPLSSHKFYNSQAATHPQFSNQHTNQNNDLYYNDGYYSSDSAASSNHIRSGSSTPIQIDKIDHRMENMERQLSGLSSLVHSALINTTNINPTTQKDIVKLRKQIMELQPASLSSKESDEDDFFNSLKINNMSSNHSILDFNSSMLSQRSIATEGNPRGEATQLQKILKETHLTQNELKQLKFQAEVSIFI